MMRFRVVKDIDEFKLLEKEWDFLYNRGNYSVFQSFIFNYYSWKNIMNNMNIKSLFIIKISENNTTIGFVPLYIDQTNTVRFINDSHSDFCDFILDRKINLDRLFQFIFIECKQRRLELINFRNTSIINSFNFNDKNYCLFKYRSVFYSQMIINKGDFPNNCKRLLSKQKSEIRRVEKKYLNTESKILSFPSYPFPKNEILILRDKMLHSGFRSSNFLPLSQLELIEQLYEKNFLEISLVKDIEVRAMSFVMRHQDSFMFWIDLYDDYKMINIYNYISYIKLRSAQDTICINFGRGVYPYKTSNFLPDILELYTFSFFPNRLSKHLYIIKSYFLNIILDIYRKFK